LPRHPNGNFVFNNQYHPILTLRTASGAIIYKGEIIYEQQVQILELTEDERKLLEGISPEDADALADSGETRQCFLKQMSAAGGTILAAQMLHGHQIFPHSSVGAACE
jgi:hypothetical protein